MSFPQSGIEAVVQNLNGFLADVGKMDKAIQGIGSDTSAIRNWNDSITTVTANVAKVVATAAAAGTAAITAFVVDSTKKSADLESSLSGIAAVLNKGTEAVGPLKDLILDLGIDPALKVSATEAADAVEMLARNGLDMTEIMDGAAKSTVLLANATGADFGTAADIATDAMAIFNIQAKDMDEAVNGITGVTTASKFSIDDYKLALAQAGGVAGTVGVSFDDFNTTIAGIAPLFASGSDAGTSFKTFLQRLIPASEPAADAMKDLGLFTGLTKKEFESAQDKIQKYQEQLSKLDPTSKNYAERAAELDGKIQVLKNSLVAGSNAFFDANGQMKDMDEIAGILNEALAGLSEEKKNDALATIFGTDAMRAAVGVANLGTKGYQELGAQIAEIDAGNQAKTRMDNLSGSLEILAGIVETLQIRIGDKFNPVFKGLVDQTSDFLSRNSDRIVNFFGKLADMVKVAVDKLIPMVESWLPKLEEGVDGGAASMEGMIDKVGGIIKGVKDFTDKIIGVVKPVADWITQNYELEDILNGILAVIAVSLIPAIISLTTTIAPVIALFTSVAELSSRMTEGQKQFAIAIGVAVFALPPLISAITTVSGVISGAISLITGAAGIIPALGAILNPVGLVVAAVAGLGLAWATDFGGIRTKTTEIVGQVSQTIGTWSAGVVTKFQETQGKIGTTLAGWSASLGTTLASMSSQTGSTLATWASGVEGKFNTLRTNAQNAFSGMTGSIKTSASNLASDVLFSVNRIQTEGTTIFGRFRENAIGKVGELVRDVPSRLREMVDAGLRIFDVGKWIQAGADIIGGVMTGLARAATAPLRWIENFASGLISLFTSKLKIASPSQVFDEFGVNIMEGLEGGLEARSGGVLSFMGTFSDALVATTAEAQRQADKNFAALIESATAAFSGYTVIAGDIAKLSQEIDQSAIDVQNAEAAYAAAKAKLGNKAPDYDALVAQGKTPDEIKAIFDNYAEQERIKRESASAFGTGRVAELIDRILNVVQTTFEKVGDTGIRSLGIDLSQFSSSAATNDAIAKLQLLAGTIQQNALNAPAVEDRNRLTSLFNDVSGRILPLLRSQAQKQQSEEQKANAPAIARSNLDAALTKINEIAGFTRAFGFFGNPDQVALQNATQSQIDTYMKLNSHVKEIGLVIEGITSRVGRVGVEGLGLDRFIQEIQSIGSYFSAISQLGDDLELTAYAGKNTETDTKLQSTFASLVSATISALPVLAGDTNMQTNVNVGNINNGMDIAALQALIQQAIANALP